MECKMDTVHVIKVSTGYYEHVPATCVHPFFFNGQLVTEGGERFTQVKRQKCRNPDQHHGGQSCCGGCTNKPSGSMTKKGRTCWDPLDWSDNLWTKCRTDSQYKKHKFCQLACWLNSSGYDG